MLIQLREYIEREKMVSLQQIIREFHIEESALKPMLDRWVQKGVISAHHTQKGCKSICLGCSSSVVFYQSRH